MAFYAAPTAPPLAGAVLLSVPWLIFKCLWIHWALESVETLSFLFCVLSHPAPCGCVENTANFTWRVKGRSLEASHVCASWPSVVSWLCATSALGILHSFLAWRFLWCTLECHVSRQKVGYRRLSSLPVFLGCECATARCALELGTPSSCVDSEVCLRRNNGQPSFIHTSHPTPWVVIEVFCVICRSIGLQAGVTGEQTPFYLKDFISSWWDRNRQESEGFSYCVIMWNVLEAPGRDSRRWSESVPKATVLSHVL